MHTCLSPVLRLAVGLAVSAAGLEAQSLTTTFAGGQDLHPGGAVLFDLDCTSSTGIEISSMVFHFADPVGTTGTLDVYVAPDNVSSFEPWSLLVGGIPVTAVGAGAPTPMPLPSPSPMQMGGGCSYRVAVVANGLRHSFSTGLATTYSNAELTLDNGGATNTPFGSSLTVGVAPNLVVFYQTGGTCLPLATTESLGSGCGEQASSAHQLFSPAGNGIQSLRFTKDLASDAVAIERTSEAVQAAGQVGPPQQVPFSNNSALPLGSHGLVVGSNGWVARGLGNSVQGIPNTSLLLTNPAECYYAWLPLDHQLAPLSAVFYEEGAGPGGVERAVVTFDQIPSWFGINPVSLQFVFDFQPGPTPELLEVTIRFGGSAAMLVGYSPQGGSRSAPVNFATLPQGFTTDPVDSGPLQVATVGRPIQGSVSAPFEVTTSNIPATAVLHAGFVGISNPMLPLDFLQMPGCTQYASLDVIRGPDILPPSSVTWRALTLDAAPPSSAGFEFYVQSFILGTPLNPAFGGLGELTSNGVKCTIGTL